MPRATTWNKDVNQAELLPEAMSRSGAQLQLGSVLNSVAEVATGTHKEVWDLDLEPTIWTESAAGVESGGHATSGAVQIWVACATTRGFSLFCLFSSEF